MYVKIVSNGVEQCRSMSNVSNLTFDMHGASSHQLVSKWCRTRVERVSNVSCVEHVSKHSVSKCVEVSKPGLRDSLIPTTVDG